MIEPFCEMDRAGRVIEDAIEDRDEDVSCRVQARDARLVPTGEKNILLRWGLWCKEYGFVAEQWGTSGEVDDEWRVYKVEKLLHPTGSRLAG